MAEPRSRRRIALAAAAAGVAALLALPVIGQQSATEPQVPASETDSRPAAAPKSLLPDSFDGAAAPSAPSDAPLLAGPDAVAPLAPSLLGAPVATVEQVDPFAVAEPSGRDITVFGPLTPAAGAMALPPSRDRAGRSCPAWRAASMRRSVRAGRRSPCGAR